MKGDEVRALKQHATLMSRVGVDGERIARGRRAVDLDAVEPVAAVLLVAAVAVVPHQQVVAVVAGEGIRAAIADQAVVTRAPEEGVGAIAAVDDVGAITTEEVVVRGAAVQRDARESGKARRVLGGEDVVAAEAVDRQPLGGEVDPEQAQIRAIELDPTGLGAWLGGERIAGRRGPVDLDLVVPGVTVVDVGAVSVVPGHHVVAVAARGGVGALKPDEAVVARVAMQGVVVGPARDEIVALAAADRQRAVRVGCQGACVDDVGAAATVDDDLSVVIRRKSRGGPVNGEDSTRSGERDRVGGAVAGHGQRVAGDV